MENEAKWQYMKKEQCLIPSGHVTCCTSANKFTAHEPLSPVLVSYHSCLEVSRSWSLPHSLFHTASSLGTDVPLIFHSHITLTPISTLLGLSVQAGPFKACLSPWGCDD